LLSLAALWLGWGMTSQIDALNQNVSELQQRVLAQSRRGTLAPPAQLDEQLAGLEERVNDLAVIIEGPMSHLRESSQQELKALELRLGRLEQGPAQQRQSPLATDNTAAPGKSDPAPVVPAPLASNEWVINLLSVTSARSANDEVARLLQLGIRAEHQKVSEGGSTWYRLRVTGFDSYAGARSYIDTIERQTGFSSAWVAKK
jgi:cell division protein FtsN